MSVTFSLAHGFWFRLFFVFESRRTDSGPRCSRRRSCQLCGGSDTENVWAGLKSLRQLVEHKGNIGANRLLVQVGFFGLPSCTSSFHHPHSILLFIKPNMLYTYTYMLAAPLQSCIYCTSACHLLSLCLFFLYVLFPLSISMSLMHRVVLRSRRLRPTPPHIALRPPVLAVDASTWHLFKQGAFESQYSGGPHIMANAFGSSYDTVLGHIFVRNLEASKAQPPPTDTGGAAACTSRDGMEESRTASGDPDETRVSKYPTCPQTDGHLLVTEKEEGNCLNAS